MRSVLIAGFVATFALSVRAEDTAEIAGKMKEAKVSLEKGIAASKSAGKPISAKYEVEKGKLQLSVYTAKGDSFSEVIVNHKNGKIAKREPITGGVDLTAAKAQKEAMSDAKTSVLTAGSKAVKANKGDKAGSAMPARKDGHATVDETFVNGCDAKT